MEVYVCNQFKCLIEKGDAIIDTLNVAFLFTFYSMNKNAQYEWANMKRKELYNKCQAFANLHFTR